MNSTKIPNNAKIVLEMTAFDAKFILPALEKQYYQKATWDITNELFSCCASTLEACREKRDAWLKKIL
ncbi:DUF3873 family protein [Bacteroides hominis]|uniref:DUF3873 family protein n=1 Tax=Bacteroides hominis TaxID=2763023 RepID=UPI003D6BA60C